MPRELINASITHVSYVDKGANQKQFFFTKSDKKPNIQKEVKLFINKDEEEQQLVYGVVYEPDVEDSHGDVMTAKEIEKAAHGFVKDARNIDTQHDFQAGVGEVVESYIAPIDFELGEQTITKGSWVLVTKASDEIWESIKKGDITGYSMAGTAETIEKENSAEEEKPVSKSEDDEEVKGFFNLVKNFFTKGEVRDRYEQNQKRRNVWAAWDGLESVFYDAIWDNRTVDVADFDKLESAASDFLELVREIRGDEDIQKALENKPETIGKGEADMKKEEIEKLLDDKLAPINEQLEKFEKEDNVEDEVEELEESDVIKQFATVLDEKLSPINKRLETVEKARGISKQADVDEEEGKEIEKGHYLKGFL
ncbi:XkdF-like putative serine protease domain-containing protein [Ornithinibacillus sp. 4-3]|uniref:XkdF-like putative serine protease domain-containing protein n=1 Tax=Ornithinibacillus sp. 4-3 TaxID=3231488 RepID=A0AB39HTH4_9BACI